jgi:putative endonuclease
MYTVYILASRAKTLYIGITNNLERRLTQHRTDDGRGFTHAYRVQRLVYYESCELVGDALRREKQLKGWTRARKVALIESVNPAWRDLAADACGGVTGSGGDPSLRSG